MPTLKAIHIAKSLKSQPLKPKLGKEYDLPTLKTNQNEESLQRTMVTDAQLFKNQNSGSF